MRIPSSGNTRVINLPDQGNPETRSGERQWDSTIWEVSDEPRYWGTIVRMITGNGETFWLNTTGRLLPVVNILCQ